MSEHDQHFAGFRLADGPPHRPVGMCDPHVPFLQLVGVAASWSGRVCEDISGPVLVAFVAAFPRGDHQQLRAPAFAHVRLWANIFASELIYVVVSRTADGARAHFSVTHPVLSWVLAVFPAIIPAGLYSSARVRCCRAGVCFYDFARRVHRAGNVARSLNSYVGMNADQCETGSLPRRPGTTSWRC